jgi:hypothetical protein
MALRDRLVEQLGQDKVEALERFRDASQRGAPAQCGAMARELERLGGVFGWTKSYAIALGLSNALEIARGRLRPSEEISSELRSAVDAFSLLGVQIDELAANAKGALHDIGMEE